MKVPSVKLLLSFLAVSLLAIFLSPSSTSAGSASCSGTSATISWADYGNEQRYWLVMRQGDSSGPQIYDDSNIPANTTTWTVSGLTAGQTYWWRVSAYDSFTFTPHDGGLVTCGGSQPGGGGATPPPTQPTPAPTQPPPTQPTPVPTAPPSQNRPPNTPPRPFGPTAGVVGQAYTFSTTGSDPENASVKIGFNWGDGSAETCTPSGVCAATWTSYRYSGSSHAASHSWAAERRYCVQAVALTIDAQTSGWSDCLYVQIGSTPAATPTPTPVPGGGPSISIVSPAAGATVADYVTIYAFAQAPAGIDRVLFYVDNSQIATITTATDSYYVFSWYTNSYSNGSHTIHAWAKDNTGNWGASAQITVTVNNGGGPTPTPTPPAGQPTPTPTPPAQQTPPAAPSNLSFETLSCSGDSASIRIRWRDNSNNEDGFNIYRYQQGVDTNWTRISQVGANVDLWEGTVANATIYYLVEAYNSAGSASSYETDGYTAYVPDCAGATPVPTVPPTPTPQPTATPRPEEPTPPPPTPVPNRAPSVPYDLSGPQTGKIGENYTFSARVSDPDNDRVKMTFAIVKSPGGNGNVVYKDSAWSDSGCFSGCTLSISYNFSEPETYRILAIALDQKGEYSEGRKWTDPLTVVIETKVIRPSLDIRPGEVASPVQGISTQTFEPEVRGLTFKELYQPPEGTVGEDYAGANSLGVFVWNDNEKRYLGPEEATVEVDMAKLPPGLSHQHLANVGDFIDGVPTREGAYMFNLKACLKSDSTSCVSEDWTIKINPKPTTANNPPDTPSQAVCEGCPATLAPDTSYTFSARARDTDDDKLLIHFTFKRSTDAYLTEAESAFSSSGCAEGCTLSVSKSLAAGDYNVWAIALDGVSWSSWSQILQVAVGAEPTPTPTPTPTPPATPTGLNVSKPQGCVDGAYSVTLSWRNTGSGWYVDIATDPGFGRWWYRNVSGLTSTTAPDGFTSDNLGTLTLNPDTTYYWRIWNGQAHTGGENWNVAACLTPTPTPTLTPTPSPSPSPTPTPTPTPTPADTQPPTVKVINPDPTSEKTVKIGNTLEIIVEAADNINVDSVKLYIDDEGVEKDTDSQANEKGLYQIFWQDTAKYPEGSHIARIRAYDSSDNSSEPVQITINLTNNLTKPPGTGDGSLDSLKNHIRYNVDERIVNIPKSYDEKFVPLEDSFGKFLWGLAGCESDWIAKSQGAFYGLYQYSQSTWNSSNAARGAYDPKTQPPPDILNGYIQIDNTIWIIETGWPYGGGQDGLKGYQHWPNCAYIGNPYNRDWSQPRFTDSWK